jgi:hypothetical protein
MFIFAASLGGEIDLNHFFAVGAGARVGAANCRRLKNEAWPGIATSLFVFIQAE